MDEQQYRDTYKNVNPVRCVFEKTINSRQTGCRRSHRFNLADREGISCTDQNCQSQCQLFLENLRNKAKFSLKLTRVAGPLPHAREIKVQTGGILGLHALICKTSPACENMPDINYLLDEAVKHYGVIDNLPYDELMRSISQFQGRKRGKGHRSKSD